VRDFLGDNDLGGGMDSGNMLVLINKFTLCRTGSELGWVTIFGGHTTSVV